MQSERGIHDQEPTYGGKIITRLPTRVKILTLRNSSSISACSTSDDLAGCFLKMSVSNERSQWYRIYLGVLELLQPLDYSTNLKSLRLFSSLFDFFKAMMLHKTTKIYEFSG